MALKVMSIFNKTLGKRRVLYSYLCHYPLMGLHAIEFGRFTKRLELTIRKVDGLVYLIEGTGGLKIRDSDREDIDELTSNYTFDRLLFPYQGIQVSWYQPYR